ncbi:MAG: PucR family transcriptional regulator ligand-binding domain-containing protein [Lachnospiraceae bacterium]
MAIILQNILARLENVEINNIYGKEGLSNVVTWVHMVENEEIANFITHGELSFTTGIALNSENQLLSLVEKIYQKNAVGLIINTGPYIQEVPADVIAFANTHRFPIILLPWKVNMANIMRIISSEITNQRLKDVELDVAVKNAILTPYNEDAYIHHMKQKGIDTDADVICVLLNLEGCSEETLNNIIFTLKPSISYKFPKASLISVFEQVILVITHREKEELEKVIGFCKDEIEKLHKKGVKFYVGKIAQGFKNLHKSYDSAIKIAHLNYDKSCIYYDEVGIYKLLLEINDKQVIAEFLEETLKPIIEYDLYNKADLLMILTKYLESDGSVKAVADELFLHRNTVNYKIAKISELLDCNISRQEIRTKLSVSIALNALYPNILC